MQNLHPIQRCISIMTMPSFLLKVALVGHTLTHGGSAQWLQKTTNGFSFISPVIYTLSWSGNTRSKASFHIHFISSLGSPKSGTLWMLWQACITLLKSSSVLNLLISMTKPQRFAFNASGPGSTSEASTASRLILLTAVAAPMPNMVENPAILRNCLLSMLISCSPLARYDNPSSKASHPYNYGSCRKTFFC